MTLTGWISVAAGAVAGLLSGICVVAPGRSKAIYGAFHRNSVAAWILTAIDLLWVAYLLFTMSWGTLERFKPLLYMLTPASFLLLALYVDELLAPRALGGLLLLIPAPILHNARFHTSPFRYLLIVLSYVAVVAGLILVLSPYRYRRTVDFCLRSRASSLGWGLAGLALGLALVGLGVFVY